MVSILPSLSPTHMLTFSSKLLLHSLFPHFTTQILYCPLLKENIYKQYLLQTVTHYNSICNIKEHTCKPRVSYSKIRTANQSLGINTVSPFVRPAGNILLNEDIPLRRTHKAKQTTKCGWRNGEELNLEGISIATDAKNMTRKYKEYETTHPNTLNLLSPL